VNAAYESAAADDSRWGVNVFPNVTLTTHHGQSVRFYDDLIKGKIVAVDLIYTTCKYARPLEAARLAQVQRLLGDRMGRDVFLYSITIDPDHDTPAMLGSTRRNITPARAGCSSPERRATSSSWAGSSGCTAASIRRILTVMCRICSWGIRCPTAAGLYVNLHARMPDHAVLATVADQPGILHGLTKVLAAHDANITYVDIVRPPDRDPQVYLEFATERAIETVVADMRAVAGIKSVEPTPSFAKIYGKRIIIMGGGAQVGQVAMGAISEADRHNIRGERISVDTIPLVGEQNLAAAVRAVVLLPRVRLLVLAGSLMGGDITKAVEEVRAKGLRVISLNMAGSVPDAADLVVSDPVQAGVMAVMAVADTAKFDIVRQEKRRY